MTTDDKKLDDAAWAYADDYEKAGSNSEGYRGFLAGAKWARENPVPVYPFRVVDMFKSVGPFQYVLDADNTHEFKCHECNQMLIAGNGHTCNPTPPKTEGEE